MKNILFGLTFLCAAATVFAAGNARAPAALQGSEWELTGAVIDGNTVVVDRVALEQAGFGKFFTLKLNATGVNGTAAPNTYRAPYTTFSGTSKGAFALKPMVSTMMALMDESKLPKGLNESKYNAALQGANRWELRGSTLTLRSNTATLTFTRIRAHITTAPSDDINHNATWGITTTQASNEAARQNTQYMALQAATLEKQKQATESFKANK
jgi:heat shock protein HslJ